MHCTFVSSLFSVVIVSSASASVIELTDRDEWEAAVGSFTTIDFVMPPSGTLITDQYSDLGVNFTGNTYSHNSGLYQNDDWGLQAYLGAWVHFDSPQSWLAVEFPGLVRIDLYYQDELIYASEIFWVSGGRFAGVISDQKFDMAYLHRDNAPGFIENHVFIDDLHFGVPAPGGLALLALAGLAGRRRQR